MVGYVSMSPMSKVKEEKNIFLEKRKKAFSSIQSTTHIPHQFILANNYNSPSPHWKNVLLSDHQKHLLCGSFSE